MAREPITVFSARGDAAQVRALLLTWFPAAEVVGDADDWSAITVRTEAGGLTFLHNREYYAGPDWPAQKAGMQGYFARFPLGDREAQVMGLIGLFAFSLGVRFDPDYDPAGDERLTVLGRLTETLDGVLFLPSSLRDPWGRILIDSDGDTDPEGEWPAAGQVFRATGNGERPADAGADWRPEPPTPERVARRAVALMILSARAVVERDHETSDHVARNYARLVEWADELGVGPEFEPWERAALDTEPGYLEPQTAINAMWRIEGLTVLAWALGRYERLPYDRISDVDGVWAALGFFDTAAVAELLARPTLLPADQLDAFRRQMLAYHWRLREHTVRPRAMDFQTFSREGWLGPFDASAFDVIDSDLGLGGARLDRAAPEVFSTCQSIAAERHLAANWLCWGPAVYADTDRST